MDEYKVKTQKSLFDWNCLDKDFEEEAVPDIRSQEEVPELSTVEPEWEDFTKDVCVNQPDPDTIYFTTFDRKMYEAQLEQIRLLKMVIETLKSYGQYD